jgi:hypothetical protein
MKDIKEIKEVKNFANMIENLSEKHVRSVLKTMIKGDPVIRDIVLKILVEDDNNRLDPPVDVDAVAEDVFYSLENFDVNECWVRSGKKKSGKNKMTVDLSVARAMFHEEMDTYELQIKAYHESGQCEAENESI